MANLTRQEIVEQIDWERRETNSKFISPAQTVLLLDRALKRVLREPGIRTLQELQTITAAGSTTRYALNSDFKEVISLWSGEGVISGVEFQYKPPDEYAAVTFGYCYTFLEPGFIDVKFPDVDSLPSSSIRLRYWTKNIILDADGTTKKRVWENEGDTCRLDEEFDEFWIEWVVSKILRREGKKEWQERHALAMEVLAQLKEQPGSKSRRPKKAFGHYLIGS